MRLVLFFLIFLLVVPVSADSNRIVLEEVKESKIIRARQYLYHVEINVTFSGKFPTANSCFPSLIFSQHVVPWYRHYWERQSVCLSTPKLGDVASFLQEFDLVFSTANSSIYVSGIFADLVSKSLEVSLPQEFGEVSFMSLPVPGKEYGYYITSISFKLIDRLSMDRLWLELDLEAGQYLTGKVCYNIYTSSPAVWFDYRDQTYGMEGGLVPAAQKIECLKGKGKFDVSFKGWLNISKDDSLPSFYGYVIFGDIETTISLGVMIVKVELYVVGSNVFILRISSGETILLWSIGFLLAVLLFRRLVRRRQKDLAPDEWFVES